MEGVASGHVAYLVEQAPAIFWPEDTERTTDTYHHKGMWKQLEGEQILICYFTLQQQSRLGKPKARSCISLLGNQKPMTCRFPGAALAGSQSQEWKAGVLVWSVSILTCTFASWPHTCPQDAGIPGVPGLCQAAACSPPRH